VDTPKDRGTIIGDGNTLVVGINLLQNLVQSLGAERRLDEIGNRNGADKRRETSIFAL
jgi:hypothetical protein